jgi:hypothetical protein
MIQLLVNGVPVGSKLVIPSSQSEIRTITVVHNQGTAAAGKLVTIETSSPTFISALSGNLNANGQFQFVVGPSFGTRGSVSLSISVGQGKKSLEITYV